MQPDATARPHDQRHRAKSKILFCLSNVLHAWHAACPLCRFGEIPRNVTFHSDLRNCAAAWSAARRASRSLISIALTENSSSARAAPHPSAPRSPAQSPPSSALVLPASRRRMGQTIAAQGAILGPYSGCITTSLRNPLTYQTATSNSSVCTTSWLRSNQISDNLIAGT